MTNQHQEIFILAFSIVRTGETEDYETIGIEASLVDPYFKELGTFKFKGFVEGMALSHDTRLDRMLEYKYEGLLTTKISIQTEMVQTFVRFVHQCERLAEKLEAHVEICCQDKMYDANHLSRLIAKGFFDFNRDMNGNYRYVWDLASEQRGFLMGTDSDFKYTSNFSKFIEKMYYIPVVEYRSDAYLIAREQQAILGIRDKRFLKRTE